jgi:hypothetical protein
MVEELAALASAAGSALVSAMVSDGWEGTRARFARLLGRGDAQHAEAAAGRLEWSKQALAGLSGPGLEEARAEEEIAWRTRLRDLLEQDPDAERELRVLVSETRAAREPRMVVQHAVASGQARQAVQGHGIQNVTFGGQHGPADGTR